jgi:hypothetical protein
LPCCLSASLSSHCTPPRILQPDARTENHDLLSATGPASRQHRHMHVRSLSTGDKFAPVASVNRGSVSYFAASYLRQDHEVSEGAQCAWYQIGWRANISILTYTNVLHVWEAHASCMRAHLCLKKQSTQMSVSCARAAKLFARAHGARSQIRQQREVGLGYWHCNTGSDTWQSFCKSGC